MSLLFNYDAKKLCLSEAVGEIKPTCSAHQRLILVLLKARKQYYTTFKFVSGNCGGASTVKHAIRLQVTANRMYSQ